VEFGLLWKDGFEFEEVEGTNQREGEARKNYGYYYSRCTCGAYNCEVHATIRNCNSEL
jgi:hypothetical protein